jgi:hypothetical protein
MLGGCRTGHLLHAILGRYRYTNLLGISRSKLSGRAIVQAGISLLRLQLIPGGGGGVALWDLW